MKKYQGLLAVAALSIGVLAACGDDEEVTIAPDNTPTDQANGGTTQSPADEPFSFTQFSLDVDYGNNKEFDVSYENDLTGVEATYENDVTKEIFNGNDAYTKLDPIFKGFTFDINTPNEDVIKEVKQAFNIGEDYKELEIDVQFTDGSEKEFKDVK